MRLLEFYTHHIKWYEGMDRGLNHLYGGMFQQLQTISGFNYWTFLFWTL